MIIKLTTSIYNEYGEDEGGVSKEFNSIHDAVKAMESFTVSGGAGCQASSNYSVLTDSGECLFSGQWEELKALSNTKEDCIGVVEMLPDNTADHRGFWYDGENAFQRAFSTLLDCRDMEPSSVFRIMHASDFYKLQKPEEPFIAKELHMEFGYITRDEKDCRKEIVSDKYSDFKKYPTALTVCRYEEDVILDDCNFFETYLPKKKATADFAAKFKEGIIKLGYDTVELVAHSILDDYSSTEYGFFLVKDDVITRFVDFSFAEGFLTALGDI